MPESPNAGWNDFRRVGALYDAYSIFYAIAVNAASLHRGYYVGPEDSTKFSEAADRLTRHVATYLDLSPGDHLLDIGCGTGQPDILIAQETGCRVTGLNVGSGQIAMARMLTEAAGLTDRLTFELSDGLSYPFLDGTFDAVLFFESIAHIPDKEAAIREAVRCLKPGGTLTVVENFEIPHAGTAQWRSFLEETMRWYPSTVDDTAKMFRSTGLALERVVDLTEQTEDAYRRALEEASARQDEVVRFLGAETGAGMLDGLKTLVETLAGKIEFAVLTGRKEG